MRTQQGVELLTQAPGFSPRTFFLRIADITIAVSGNDPEMTFRVEGAAKKFLVDESPPDVEVCAAWGDLSSETIEPVREALGQVPDNSSAFPCPPRGQGVLARPEIDHKSTRGEQIFDSGALWQLYHRNGTNRFSFTSPALGLFPYKVASFNNDFTCGEVLLHRSFFNPDQPVYPLEYPLDELLIINLLAKGKGVEVHACGVIDALGNGHLLVGQSGAGKTTMARLWQPVLSPSTPLRINFAEGKEEAVTILSDDRIILGKDGNRLWMYGTPWHGDAGFSCSARAPLKQIFLLRHGQKNELLPMRGVEAASRLFACSFPPFYNPAALDYTLAFFEEVVRAVPCHELRFVPNVNVVKFILDHSAISYW